MRVILQFAEINMEIKSDRNLEIPSAMKSFFIHNVDEIHCQVTVHNDWKQIDNLSSHFVGEDIIQNYYQIDNQFYCELKGGDKGSISCTKYDQLFNKFDCALNQDPFLSNLYDLGKILRMLPMKAFFVHHNTLFFHASQILFDGQGILFSGPSGIGKTTQARLWEKYEDAQMICNDRVLIRKVHGNWYTYGYPLDGSTPISTSSRNKLGAIVLLEQGHTNELIKISKSKMICNLIEQIVLDTWSMDEQQKVIQLLLSLIAEIPVFRLSCTPNVEAVKFLKQCLIKERVIDSEYR